MPLHEQKEKIKRKGHDCSRGRWRRKLTIDKRVSIDPGRHLGGTVNRTTGQ